MEEFREMRRKRQQMLEEESISVLEQSTSGRHVHEMADSNGEMALVMLSELFNHSNIAITKRYLGLRKEEIMHCYDLLDF